MDIFFSCSFQETDKDLNAFFLAICKALNLRATNVSTGSPRVPPAEAKEQIERAQAVVAVCPQRTEMAGGGFVMPPAVRDEIAIAFGTDTPLLMLVEQGVDSGGFQNNLGTFLQFDRSSLTTPDFIGKAVEAIHNLKLFALGPHQGHGSGLPESHAEFINHSVELRPSVDSLTWTYSTVKRLIYSQASRRSFPVGVWATVPVNAGDADNMRWSVSLRSASRNIVLEHQIEKHTPSCVEARIKLNPPAEEGDYIEYVTRAESPYINPIWREDLADDATAIHLDEGSYLSYDGLMFIHRTKKAILEFRFSMESGLRRADIRPFVGVYSSNIDYEVASELKRAEVKLEDFGDMFSVRMEIDSPLPGHMYGVAWNPKNNPDRQVSRMQGSQRGGESHTESLITNHSA